jgi:nucleoside-diphosphate-sugar epimerase
MEEANVRGTERVLDQATRADVARIVYVSTVNVFGNTRGQVVDETFRRTDFDWLSWYDKTKYEAHQVAVDRSAKGAPVLIAQPGGVYGPGDVSEAATMVRQMAMGRLRMKMFPDTGLNMVHVDDIADGILLVHDKGKIGEAYVIGGQITTLGEIIAKVAALAGKKPPRVTLPAWMARSAIPIAPVVTKAMGFPPNLRELIKASDGVTYWATDAKARRELGYSPRDLDTGLRQMLETEGMLAT